MNDCPKKVKRTNLFKKLLHKYRKWRRRNEPSNLEKWALNELKMLEGNSSDEMQCLMTKDIMEVVKVFCKQGHSGFSASYALNLIKRLLDWKPILPLTGEEDEWNDKYDEDNSQQNKRCSAVFRKNFDNSTAYYIGAKAFSDDGGETWFTNHDSFINITFPYNVPDKPEFVYLKQEEENEN